MNAENAAPVSPADEPTPAPEGAGTSDTEQSPEPDDADTFSRSYVEKLRKESAGYRTERDQLSQLLAEAQRDRIDIEILSHGLKPDAVWKTIEDPVELLGENGHPDPGKIRTAVEAARKTLGIKPEKAKTGLRSGSTTGPQLPRTEKFSDAFKPARER